MLANGFAPGGQLTTTTDVENYPGLSGVTGPQMMDLFRNQSLRFGTEIHTETISRVDLSSRPFKYWREGGEQDDPETCDSMIIATGASARRLNLPGEETYWQSGISACAVCDGAVPIFRNKPLAVVGGGDSACEEATYLTKVFTVCLPCYTQMPLIQASYFYSMHLTCMCWCEETPCALQRLWPNV